MTKNVKKTVKNVKKTVKNVQKVSQNVKKSPKTTKKDVNVPKMYTEEQICKVACMVFMLESQIARLTAACGVYFGDEMSKYKLLKEYMAVDASMRKLSADFHKEIESTVSRFGNKACPNVGK